MATTWTRDELSRIADAEELELASQRGDGSMSRPTTMWVVRDGDHLYVRSIHGRDGIWFRGTQANHKGHIDAGGVSKDVKFGDASRDSGLNQRIDAAYQQKYRRFGDDIVGTVIGDEARTSTIKLEPR